MFDFTILCYCEERNILNQTTARKKKTQSFSVDLHKERIQSFITWEAALQSNEHSIQRIWIGGEQVTAARGDLRKAKGF